MGNIAEIFHWPPQSLYELSLEDLIHWHREAVERSNRHAEQEN